MHQFTVLILSNQRGDVVCSLGNLNLHQPWPIRCVNGGYEPCWSLMSELFQSSCCPFINAHSNMPSTRGMRERPASVNRYMTVMGSEQTDPLQAPPTSSSYWMGFRIASSNVSKLIDWCRKWRACIHWISLKKGVRFNHRDDVGFLWLPSFGKSSHSRWLCCIFASASVEIFSENLPCVGIVIRHQ